MSENRTVIANFREIGDTSTPILPTLFTLTVNAGVGGTTTPSGASQRDSGSVVEIVAFANSGYTFNNWTVSAGTAMFGNANNASTTVTLSSNATIVANFTQNSVTSYTVTYNINGGTGTTPSQQTVTAGNSVILASGSEFTRDGFTFGGWNTSSDGTGTNYSARFSFTPTGNITLFARWVTSGGGETPDIDMVLVSGGTFTMGCTSEQGSDCWDDERPSHQVTLTNNYYIGKYPVTQAQWVAVMGSNPSHFTGDLTRPVERVSWTDVQSFIQELNRLSGRTYRLPTEAEWEFAARGGTSSLGYKYSGGNNIGDVAWNSGSGSTTRPVGTKLPNELGIYDMSGNVWEWVGDWYDSYTSSSKTNPTGPTSGSRRVIRGGGWAYGAGSCRVSQRRNFTPDYRDDGIGFRLVLSP
jgi:uncharacterized repeat protein (TIGR02543 family)